MLRFNPLSRIYTSFSPIGRRFGAISLKRPVHRMKLATFRNLSTNAGSSAPKKPTGIKALVKEYGYSALAIYFGLSMIDLPIVYILVHTSGKEKIEIYENKVKQVFGYGVPDEELAKKQEIDRIQEEIDAASKSEQDTTDDVGIIAYLVSQFSLTEFAIAYGIHKSLIFIRLPVTAAITPGIVKMLKRWGFKIGSAATATATTSSASNISVGDVTASSVKFGSKANTRRKWFWFF